MQRMREHLRFVVVLSVVSFALNAVWEISQLHFGLYANYEALAAAHTPLWLYATLGDVFYTFLAFGLLVVLKGGGVRRYVSEYFYLAMIGVVIAILVEYKALILHLWSYSSRMLVVPYLHIGLSPLLQMTFLVPISIYATSLAVRSLNKSK